MNDSRRFSRPLHRLIFATMLAACGSDEDASLDFDSEGEIASESSGSEEPAEYGPELPLGAEPDPSAAPYPLYSPPTCDKNLGHKFCFWNEGVSDYIAYTSGDLTMYTFPDGISTRHYVKNNSLNYKLKVFSGTHFTGSCTIIPKNSWVYYISGGFKSVKRIEPGHSGC